MSSKRRANVALLGGCVAAASLCFGAMPAGAAEVPGKLPFELLGVAKPGGVAVSQSNQNVYVANNQSGGAGVIDVFGSEGGAPSGGEASQLSGVQTPAGSFAFFGGQEPAAVAVDNGPASASNGDIYVVDIGHAVVDKFKVSGGEYEYVCQIAGFGNAGAGCLRNESGELKPSEPFQEPDGVTVSPDGDVFVADFKAHAVYQFSASGEDVRKITHEEHPLIAGGEHGPTGLAVDAQGDLYVNNFEQNVVKLTAEPSGHIGPNSQEAVFGPVISKVSGVAVDAASGDVYVDDLAEVLALDPSGQTLFHLSSPGLTSAGVALHEGSPSIIYLSDLSSESVKAFGPVKVPDVKRCEARELTAQSATLTSEINALETEGAQFLFEYGPGLPYELQTTPTAVEGDAFKEVVSPEPVTLTPGTTYHCRVSATDTPGISGGAANNGEDSTFTTPPLPPEVSATTVSGLTAEGAVFRGTINPGNGPTTYHFAYGEEPGQYPNALPNIGIGSGLSPIEVEQDADELKPDTVYHFALIATNAANQTVSEDGTFTTPPLAGPPSTPPIASTGAATATTQNTATIAGTVDTEGVPTTYEFDLGTTPTYGTRIFGQLTGEPHATGVTSVLANLAPDVTYHYRLVASNAAGTSYGADQTFTTAAFPAGVSQPATPLLIPFTPPSETPGKSTSSPKPLTRAQKLANALRACRRRFGAHRPGRRARCERQATRKYGLARKRTKASK
jgi:hypothetical protein